mmetsp:Transcript_28419/g.83793  ORF Transcript_28419/g.83793 Transcript_28419/m.83793 type:complete len:307 (+) Transcript_28419:652-1572(+)
MRRWRRWRRRCGSRRWRQRIARALRGVFRGAAGRGAPPRRRERRRQVDPAACGGGRVAAAGGRGGAELRRAAFLPHAGRERLLHELSPHSYISPHLPASPHIPPYLPIDCPRSPEITRDHPAQDAAHRVSGGASAWEWICGEAAGLGEGAVRRALRQMGFPATAQRKPVSALSGGERTRLCIASMLLSRANLLVLDEPTNHLDLRAREYLGDALRSFDGAVLLVSHDRAFAAHVATRVAELRGGRLHAEQGDYRAYIERRDELRARIDRRAVSAGLPAEGGERGGTDGASSDRPSKRAARRRRSSR